MTIYVDSRQQPYRWRLHRLGQAPTVSRGTGRRPVLRIRAPRGPSGVYVLELLSPGRRAKVPIAVDGPGRERILLVLPQITWQGLNPVDDDGDGLPNTLERGGPVRVERPFAGIGEPPGFAGRESPLLRLLDRPRQRYDLATDYELALDPRRLDRYSGVVLAGDSRWLEPGLATRLRRYVLRGGKVLSLGTESLRRDVSLRDGLLANPSGQSAFDLTGSRIEPVTRKPVALLAADDAVRLFEGGDGSFTGFDAYEETRDAGKGARIVSRAQDASGRRVIVAIQVGKGLVIRTGLPGWHRRLSDPNVEALVRRAWAILGS
jgi:hypothetical protein